MRVAARVAERARFVQSGTAFVAMRAVIGCGLATFVCCQVWCSQQFSKNVVRRWGDRWVIKRTSSIWAGRRILARLPVADRDIPQELRPDLRRSVPPTPPRPAGATSVVVSRTPSPRSCSTS